MSQLESSDARSEALHHDGQPPGPRGLSVLGSAIPMIIRPAKVDEEVTAPSIDEYLLSVQQAYEREPQKEPQPAKLLEVSLL